MCRMANTVRVRSSVKSARGNCVVLARSRTMSLMSPSPKCKGSGHFRTHIESHPHGTLTVTLRSTHTFPRTKKSYANPKNLNGTKNRAGGCDSGFTEGITPLKPESQPHARFFDRTIFSPISFFQGSHTILFNFVEVYV